MWTHINSIWLDGIIPDDMREEISAVEHENPRNIKGGNLNAMATWSSVRVYAEIRSGVRVYAEIDVHWTAPSSVRVYAGIRSGVRVYAEIDVHWTAPTHQAYEFTLRSTMRKNLQRSNRLNNCKLLAEKNQQRHHPQANCPPDSTKNLFYLI